MFYSNEHKLFISIFFSKINSTDPSHHSKQISLSQHQKGWNFHYQRTTLLILSINLQTNEEQYTSNHRILKKAIKKITTRFEKKHPISSIYSIPIFFLFLFAKWDIISKAIRSISKTKDNRFPYKKRHRPIVFCWTLSTNTSNYISRFKNCLPKHILHQKEQDSSPQGFKTRGDLK